MKRHKIDINVDVGEGVGNEAELLPFVSSCNIACGGHAGDETTMRQVVQLANQWRIKIGAHPSFPDTSNFGRIPMNMSCAALFTSLKDQVESLNSILRQEHAQLHHIKPHGALYNQAAHDLETATVIVELMKRFHLSIKLYVPYGSVISEVAQKEDIPIVYEAFADRNYNPDLSLVSRKQDHAIIHNFDNLFQHVMHMIKNQKVRAINGEEVTIQADTFCLHGDHPKAVEFASKLREKLEAENIEIL